MADVDGVTVTYFTDPWCPWSWAAEPARRRLEVEFGDSVAVTYVICGMAHALQDRSRFASTWLEAAVSSGMPADPRALLTDPPSSTNPAALAVKAVAEQADPGPFLRRLREAIMVEGRRADRADGLLDIARETGDLDLDRLRIDFGSNATVERLGADFDVARARAGANGRVALPTVVFAGPFGEHAVFGSPDWTGWRDAAVAAGARPADAGLPDVLGALRRFGSMATAEVALVCDLRGPRAPADLWRHALEWRVRARPVLGGELWELA